MKRLHSFSLASLVCSAITLAQPVLIHTTDITINPGDDVITDQSSGTPVALATAQITVRGRTLTINGRHSIASLTVERSGAQPGIITHSAGFSHDYSGGGGTDIVHGTHLTIEGNVVVQGTGGGVASRIDASGRGYPGGAGPGAGGSGDAGYGSGSGGGYGGEGGSGNGRGGTPYGSLFTPTDPGSGGGHANSGSGGGAGGGVVRLIMTGTLTIDGSILANGANGGISAGGGSGGSIWITAPSIIGSGSISANGGAAGSTFAGSGSGGRIAVEACLFNLPSNRVTVVAGTGGRVGCLGTASLRHTGVSTLVVSSNDPAFALPFGMNQTPAVQVIRANQPPPLFPGEGWTPVLRQRNGSHIVSYDNCDAAMLPDSSYVSTLTPIPSVDEVTFNNCASAFYRFSFDLPDEFAEPVLQGFFNADDAAVVWLNGVRISAPADSERWNTNYTTQCSPALTWPRGDDVRTQDPVHFRAGENELVVSVLGDLSTFEPSGLEFIAHVQYRTPGQTGTPLLIESQPSAALTCPFDVAQFGITASGVGELIYTWQYQPESGGAWITLINGYMPGIGMVTGTNSESLEIVEPDFMARGGRVRSRVTAECGTVFSNPAMLFLCACPSCPADFNFDGGIDGADIDLFFSDWESDVPCADVNRDGGIDGGDIEAFYAAWESGQCG